MTHDTLTLPTVTGLIKKQDGDIELYTVMTVFLCQQLAAAGCWCDVTSRVEAVTADTVETVHLYPATSLHIDPHTAQSDTAAAVGPCVLPVAQALHISTSTAVSQISIRFGPRL